MSVRCHRSRPVAIDPAAAPLPGKTFRGLPAQPDQPCCPPRARDAGHRPSGPHLCPQNWSSFQPSASLTSAMVLVSVPMLPVTVTSA